jgi:pyridoxal phosphate enzyme (YggS family)
MTDLSQQRQQILNRIEQACALSGRDVNGVHLLAVSKRHPAAAIRQLYAAGQLAFAENYLQEALSKQTELTDLPLEWHFIGHIQRNKTKDIAANFHWVHGVDRLVIAERLSSQRPDGLGDLQICIQINIDDEDSKAGCTADELPNLIAQISRLPMLSLRGLMVIPAQDSPSAFARTQQLFAALRVHHAQPQVWDTLSMGMSADLEQAIAHGSTCVRVGTALFGARPTV